MAIPEEWYDDPVVLPTDKDAWVKGPIREAMAELRARRGVPRAAKRDRVGQLEQQVADLQRQLDELRAGIVAAAQTTREPAAADE